MFVLIIGAEICCVRSVVFPYVLLFSVCLFLRLVVSCILCFYGVCGCCVSTLMTVELNKFTLLRHHIKDSGFELN